MKKLMIFCLLAICLLSLPAAAEAGKPLYAVEDINGKWGYIDNEGMPGDPVFLLLRG